MDEFDGCEAARGLAPPDVVVGTPEAPKVRPERVMRSTCPLLHGVGLGELALDAVRMVGASKDVLGSPGVPLSWMPSPRSKALAVNANEKAR